MSVCVPLLTVTIILGINFGAYVLLAADTLAILVDLKGIPRGVRDDHEKICNTNIGIVAGRGTDELLELVNSRFDEVDDIISTDDLKRIINEERQHFREVHEKSEQSEQSIQNTAWLFSYVTFREGMVTQGTPILRLGVVGYAGDIIGRRHLVDNYPFVIPPPGTTDQDTADITATVHKLIKPINQFEKLSESIGYHAAAIANVIRLYQPKLRSISSSCQIGVFTSDGFFGVSPIIKATDGKIPMVLKEVPPTPSILSTSGESTTLTNEPYRFRIAFPRTWEMSEARSRSDPTRVRIFLPTGDYADNVSVNMYSLDPDTSLDDVIKSTLNEVRNLNSITVLDQGYSFIGNYPSYTMVYLAVGPVQPNEIASPRDLILKTKLNFTVKNRAVYIVSFNAASDNFDNYFELAQHIMNSFALTGEK